MDGVQVILRFFDTSKSTPLDAPDVIKVSAAFVFSAAITVFLFLVTLSEHAQAQEIHEFYRGVRSLGMGGAYTAVVNDETAVLTNPAGLGKLRDITLTLINPELSGSFNDTDILNVGSATKAMGMQSLLDALNKAPGKHFYGGAQVFPSFVGPNFGIGVLGKYTVNGEVDPTGTTYHYDYINDLAPALGYCFRFFGGVVKFGLATRLVNRTELLTDVPATSTNLKVAPLSSGGFGTAVDLGLNLTAPVAALPTLAIAVRDVGTTTYNLSKGFLAATTTRPHATAQTIDLGVALFPIAADHVRTSITVEVHDITRFSQDKDAFRRFHAGGELNFADFLFLRAGMNQSYATGGIEFSTERIQLQAATYGEEIGTSAQKKQDRRWVAEIAFRF
jgi:hypothetical protein